MPHFHPKYGASVNFLAQVGIRKYWVKLSLIRQPQFLGKCCKCCKYIVSIMYFMLITFLPVEDFFSFTPWVKWCVASWSFYMSIWHPTNEVTLDELMAVQLQQLKWTCKPCPFHCRIRLRLTLFLACFTEFIRRALLSKNGISCTRTSSI